MGMLSGKGLFIWQIEKCAPDAGTLVVDEVVTADP